jgi:hypothetical protein
MLLILGLGAECLTLSLSSRQRTTFPSTPAGTTKLSSLSSRLAFNALGKRPQYLPPVNSRRSLLGLTVAHLSPSASVNDDVQEQGSR